MEDIAESEEGRVHGEKGRRIGKGKFGGKQVSKGGEKRYEWRRRLEYLLSHFPLLSRSLGLYGPWVCQKS